MFAISATAGTTNLGMVDDLSGLADVAEREGLWLHVDGAYGGTAILSSTGRQALAGIDRVHSMVVDPHKWLFAGYDCGALLYRDVRVARAAFTQTAEYLDAVEVSAEEWNPSDYAVHLTRRARGVPLWFSLATHGTDAYRTAVDTCLNTRGPSPPRSRRRRTWNCSRPPRCRSSPSPARVGSERTTNGGATDTSPPATSSSRSASSAANPCCASA